MNCPVCGESRFLEWGRVGAYSVQRCHGCGLGMTDPFPVSQDRLAQNEETYQVEKRIQAYLSRKKYFEKRYRGYILKIEKISEGKKLLDVGCNIGLFLNVAGREGFEAVGVELNGDCARFGRSHFGVEIVPGDLENARFADESFDVITLFDVLEHVAELKGFLCEIQRVLKKDGLLVVQSPNLESLMARLTGSDWHWLSPPDHLYHFSPGALQRLLADCGFSVKQVETWEPFEDFLVNLLEVRVKWRALRRCLVKLVRLSRPFCAPALLFQRRWWRRQEGALVEVYATKDGESPRAPAGGAARS